MGPKGGLNQLLHKNLWPWASTVSAGGVVMPKLREGHDLLEVMV